MKYFSLLTLALLLTSCAADPMKVQQVGSSEAARLQSPSKPLSDYKKYILAPMAYSEQVRAEAGKVLEAEEFEAAFTAAVSPLLSEWESRSKPGATETLIIEPRLVALKVVSGGARFWAGAFVGDSFIDMDLYLIEESSRNEIARVRISRSADSMTGAWSVGKSDQNLDQYIVSIAENYLRDNY